MTERSTRRTTRRSMRRTTRRSMRNSSRIRKSAEYPTLETVLTYFFNVGGHEIRKSEPGYEPPTAKEFLQEVRSILRPSARTSVRASVQSGGSTKVRMFTQKLVGATVGTFDTPCNTLLSYFSIVVWAAFFYTFAVAYFQFPQSQLMDAFANPVFAMIDILQGGSGSGIGPTRQLKDNIREFAEAIPFIPSMANIGIQRALFLFLNSEGYKRLVEASLACLLLSLGVVSCYEKCNEHIVLSKY